MRLWNNGEYYHCSGAALYFHYSGYFVLRLVLSAWKKSIHHTRLPRNVDAADNQRFNVAKQNEVIPNMLPIIKLEDLAGLLVLDRMLGIKDNELAKVPIAIT